MKTLLFLIAFFPSIAWVQPDLDGINQALRSGNADALGAYFAPTVEVAIMNSEDRYAKADAVRVMKDFFARNRPSSFSQVHQGESKGGNMHYAIGELQSTGSSYRVYLLLQESAGNYTIQQLRIDQE
ncbi:MAG: DUF4783 domain-containing protein [Lewinellaceae bacterium]|nr:DUF4783 domain-containing protein [Lewinellaceae bacterium]